MKGVTLRRVTRKPVKRPHKAPVAIPRKAAAKGDTPEAIKRAITTVHKAIVEPTERSIPPEMMIKVIPSAAIPTTALWSSIISKLFSVRKVFGLRKAKTKNTKHKPKTGPNLPIRTKEKECLKGVLIIGNSRVMDS